MLGVYSLQARWQCVLALRIQEVIAIPKWYDTLLGAYWDRGADTRYWRAEDNWGLRESAQEQVLYGLYRILEFHKQITWRLSSLRRKTDILNHVLVHSQWVPPKNMPNGKGGQASQRIGKDHSDRQKGIQVRGAARWEQHGLRERNRNFIWTVGRCQDNDRRNVGSGSTCGYLHTYQNTDWFPNSWRVQKWENVWQINVVCMRRKCWELYLW